MHYANDKTVFIAEDSAALRYFMIDMISLIEGVRIVGEAETPTAAVQGILATNPAYVVLDFHLFGGTGIDVLRQLPARTPPIVVIMLTNHPNSTYRRISMDAGAHYFFDKNSGFAEIKAVIDGCYTTTKLQEFPMRHMANKPISSLPDADDSDTVEAAKKHREDDLAEALKESFSDSDPIAVSFLGSLPNKRTN
jgi:DNA-binding NarL/FixJ family response regulator